ncbi:MAG: proton-conducting transporter transmembrane domain-containing protein [Acidimicrobiales bacterium]
MPPVAHLAHLAIVSRHFPEGSAALMLAAGVPWLLAILTRLLSWRATARLAWVPTGAAVAAGIAVAASGSSIAGIDSSGGHLIAGLQADAYSTTLVILVTFVGALVQSFALRQLQSDTQAARFSARSQALVGAMVIVVSSATLAGLVIGWVIAGVTFTSVLGYRPELPGAKRSSVATRRAFLIGDTALVAATCWIILRSGNVMLTSPRYLQAAANRLGAGTPVVALLVAISALARSAQFPLGRWMAGTVNAPTPVSALLHAGVVNGGGILLVRLAPLESASMLATLTIFGCASVTLAYSLTAMRARSDVKGSLALSTRAQMGFMLAECSVGLPVFATIHLIGHALYKATLFLGSGNGIRRPGTRPARPVHPHRLSAMLRPVAAGIAAGGISLGTMWIIAPGLDGYRSWPLLLFGGVTATATGRAWWLRRPRGWGWPIVAATTLAVMSALYATLLAGLGGWLASAMATTTSTPIGPWWIAVAGMSAAVFYFAVWSWMPSASLSLLQAPTAAQNDISVSRSLAGLRLRRLTIRSMVTSGDRQKRSEGYPIDGCAA